MEKFKNYTREQILSEYFQAKTRLNNPLINDYIKEKCREIVKIIEDLGYTELETNI